MITGKDAAELFNVPSVLWDSKFEDCAARDVLENYIAMRKADAEMRRLGVGLYFRGPVGRGKTTAAVQLVRRVYEDGFYKPLPPPTEEEIERRFHKTLLELNIEATEQLRAQGPRYGWGSGEGPTIYFTRAADLRNAIRFEQSFREDLVSAVLKTARVLIIDDLTQGDFSDPYVNWLSLVVDRSNMGLTTFCTSLCSYAELHEVQPLWFEQAGNVLYEVEVTGSNRRRSFEDKVSHALFKKSSEGKSEPA